MNETIFWTQRTRRIFLDSIFTVLMMWEFGLSQDNQSIMWTYRNIVRISCVDMPLTYKFTKNEEGIISNDQHQNKEA